MNNLGGLLLFLFVLFHWAVLGPFADRVAMWMATGVWGS